MVGAARSLRVVVALGLVLALGTAGELPHGHVAAEGAVDSPPPAAELHRSEPALAADDSACSACVLQRLLSQARGAGMTALERPGAAGTIAGALSHRAAGSVPASGSPRSPPPGA